MSKERLVEVMSVQSTTYGTQKMDNFLFEFYEQLSQRDPENFHYHYELGNTYITKGHAKTYPCVIAHTDTVHDIHEDLTVFEDNGIMFAMDMTRGLQVGIGGDDKVGIYIALEMLLNVDVIKVAFFRDEEHGCLGSAEADMKFFNDVEFVIQCDRQGYKDVVNNIMGHTLFDADFSHAIEPILKKYKKKETDLGGMTDVYQLVENGLKICVTNLSCGYYRPHSDDEIIILEDVFKTRDTVDEMIAKLSGRVWKNSEYQEYGRYGGYRYSTYGGGGKKTKGKKATKKYTDWVEEDELNQEWWEESDQSSSVWTEPMDRHGVPIRSNDRLDNEQDHMDLNNFCSRCDSDEIMYDKSEDCDWCFQCEDYTNVYTHHVIQEEHELRGLDTRILVEEIGRLLNK